MRVGYLGPKGTFSEEAAVRYFEDQNVEMVAFQTISDVFEDVEAGNVDSAVVPIENTIEGTINITVDSLADSPELFIQGEMILGISQQLLGVKGVLLDEIQEIWSIPPALAQCRKFIRKSQAETKHFDSTASAALKVKESGRRDVGAVASAWAAEQLGLEVIARNVQDTSANHTRFVVIANERTMAEDSQKTMLLITPGDEHSGLLADILQVFSTLDLNLSWIESRPTKTKLGTYQFYLVAEAGMQDERMSKVLAILDIYGHRTRVLGTYKSKLHVT